MKNSNSLKRESKLGIQSAQKLTKRLKKYHRVYEKAKGLEKAKTLKNCHENLNHLNVFLDR